MTRRARCCCGACEIETRDDPTDNVICHCTNCRRRTGSAFGWSAYFADSQIIDRRGRFSRYELTEPSSGAIRQQRWFCAACGTTLFWRVADYPGHTGIAGGCFTEVALPEPSTSACDESRHPWLALPAYWQKGT